MESVAERAKVSRPLVYKHFANRQDLLSALYERESAHIHDEIARAVRASVGLEEMWRSLVRGVLEAQASRGLVFATLAARGAPDANQRQRRRQRDRETARFFTRRAMRELALDEATASAGVALALSAVTTVLAQWRRDPTAARRDLLEEVYVQMAMGGLCQLARQRPAP